MFRRREPLRLVLTGEKTLGEIEALFELGDAVLTLLELGHLGLELLEPLRGFVGQALALLPDSTTRVRTPTPPKNATQMSATPKAQSGNGTQPPIPGAWPRG